MSYSYEKERARLFTEEGIRILLHIRDETKRLIALAGAFTAEKAMCKVTGDSWIMLASLDYLVENNELKRLTAKNEVWGQHQVFVDGQL